MSGSGKQLLPFDDYEEPGDRAGHMFKRLIPNTTPKENSYV
jgi:hypothetical protein